MGLTKKSCEFLLHAHKSYEDLSWNRTLTLGRQQMFISPVEVANLASEFGLTLELKTDWHVGTGYCEPFLMALGARTVESMDASDYEGASIVHDLNQPVRADLHGSFDCILDGGTIEHVFHFPNAIRSCMDMIAIGGHYVGITPADNQMGHGFYQFSPELYYRIFSQPNGFEVSGMFLQTGNDWLEINDPKHVGRRGTLTSTQPVMLAMVARKTGVMDEFHVPQQSDYEDAWSRVESVRSNTVREGESTLRHWARKYIPLSVKDGLRKAQAALRPELTVAGMSHVDVGSYRLVDLRNWRPNRVS